MMVKSLIEQWFPAATVGAESLRERGSAKAYPPVNFMHVWWARRPLTASRAAILASLLPAWPSDADLVESADAGRVRDALEAEFPGGEKSYHRWFLATLGILGDPVEGRKRLKEANAQGVKLKGNGYGYERAFTRTPDESAIARVRRLAALNQVFVGAPRVLDPFAGGGSIPFEAARLGCDTSANELNPVAAAVLNGTVALPAKLGADFSTSIDEWGRKWSAKVEARVGDLFPKSTEGETIIAYVWAHTVPCPSTGHHTPLAPSYWLATGSSGRSIAVRLHPDSLTGEISTSIVEGPDARAHGDLSTYKQGAAHSIFDGAATFDGHYIKEMATTGQMGQALLAVAVTRPGVRGRQFRAPTDDDRRALEEARRRLDSQIAGWQVRGLLPDEPVGLGEKTTEPHRMGITQWSDFFSPRQLLVMCTALEELLSVVEEARISGGSELARGVALNLAFALDRVADYNSRVSSWDATRTKIRNSFDRHDFAFKWSFAEFDGVRALEWAVDHAATNFRNVAELAVPAVSLMSNDRQPSDISVIRGSATRLEADDQTVDVIVTDPPYFDNVMYAECSDYFYVWLKRSLATTWPELCDLVLTDKQGEAVANRSLFKELADPGARGRRPGDGMSALELADQRYEELLAASFAEAHRVLKEDGVMTVMFTHKRVDAWDTLGAALLDGGFEISSSWPVHTESEHSLHQAKKNSASSTILLGCRKRQSTEPAYWADIQGEVEDAAEEAAKRFSADGIKGVDLTLATYGPALSVLSRNWPVYTGNLDENGNREIIRPDVALDRAREKVALLKKRELLGGRDVEFDRATDWWLLAWNDFQAAQFPAGEALKLCIATDLDLEDVSRGHKLVKAASGNVTIQSPAQRRTSRALDPDAGEWPTMIDALHAFMLIYDEDGLQAAERWLQQTGRKDDERFAALVEAAIHAVPRAREKNGEFARPEARILESLRAVLFDHIEAPDTEELSQPSLFDED